MSADDLAAFVEENVAAPDRARGSTAVAKFHGDACAAVPKPMTEKACEACRGLWLGDELGCANVDAGDEAMLDIEYLVGVAPGLPAEFYFYAAMDFCGARRRPPLSRRPPQLSPGRLSS